MRSFLTINERRIGPGEPVYIVAELSANHNGQYDRAAALVEAAGAAGADAVKVQTYTADTMTIDCDKEWFRVCGGTQWDGRTLYDLYDEAHMPWTWQPKLKDAANRLGMDFFSSPFDDSAVRFLENMGVPAYKIASFELPDHALLEAVAATGKPVILSTGMAAENEIEEAVAVVAEAGNEELALLHCVSAYPAAPGESRLRAIPRLAERFGAPVGLSDHTLGVETAAAAAALGACIIEKHLTLARKDGGPDAAFSLEPEEFASLVQAIRATEQVLAPAADEPSASEAALRAYRRSLFVVRDMKAGETFSPDNVRAIRPGQGLPPKHLKAVWGRRAARDIERGTPLDFGLVADE